MSKIFDTNQPYGQIGHSVSILWKNKHKGSGMSLTDVNWSLIPAPANDGGAEHLQGATLPDMPLQASHGDTVSLAALDGLTVVYVYPMIGHPDRALPDDWNDTPGARGCTPQSCAYRDHFADLQALGVNHLFGLSVQSTDQQAEAVKRLHLPYALLSDPDLAFAQAARLPKFELEGETYLRRLTMILRDGKVDGLHYPVFPPDQDAAFVASWLENNT